MTAFLLGLAAVLAFGHGHAAQTRLRRTAFQAAGAAGRPQQEGLPGPFSRGPGPAGPVRSVLSRRPNRKSRDGTVGVSLTLVVQQLAALLKGGRSPGRLWEELWILYGRPVAAQDAGPVPGSLAPASIEVLAAARAAAANGIPVSAAIRRALSGGGAVGASVRHRDARIWADLAACFDIAEASGCPLADVLTRFAAQLEVEDDAEAARQTALAGPKATVALLTWLPVLGLGLGAALGVDPLAVLLGTPLGLAALAAGVGLTVAGRIWSAKLVAAAAAAGAP